jgi:uncharacterized protein (TIGR03067 family)
MKYLVAVILLLLITTDCSARHRRQCCQCAEQPCTGASGAARPVPPIVTALPKPVSIADRLQGRWEMVSLTKYGDQAVFADQNSGWGELTISGTSEVIKMKFTEQEHTFPQQFRIRESATGNVHGIDVTAESGEVGQGIFELTGDKLRRAMSLPGGQRPTEFEKPGQVYSVWKRVAALNPPNRSGQTPSRTAYPPAESVHR